MSSFNELWLVIPTANRFQYLDEIFRKSKITPEKRILIRTSLGTDYPGCINLYETENFNIQHWWNLGIEYAKAQGARYVAVLNDDVRLDSGVLQELLSQMQTEGTALAIPVSKGDAAWGHCWIIDTQSQIKPDERFVWWCGDRDLEIQALRGQGITYKPLKTQNLHANELTVANPALTSLIDRDIYMFYRKYPFKALIGYPGRLWIRIIRRLNRK